jgi:hypothetical protein
LWLAGLADPPGDIFLRAVDVVLQHTLPAPHDPGGAGSRTEGTGPRR